MVTVDHVLMEVFFIITAYFWLSMPPEFDTVKYHRNYWLTVWHQVKDLFAELKAGKHNNVFMQWLIFAVWIFIACVAIFIITGLAFWLKS